MSGLPSLLFEQIHCYPDKYIVPSKHLKGRFAGTCLWDSATLPQHPVREQFPSNSAFSFASLSKSPATSLVKDHTFPYFLCSPPSLTKGIDGRINDARDNDPWFTICDNSKVWGKWLESWNERDLIVVFYNQRARLLLPFTDCWLLHLEWQRLCHSKCKMTKGTKLGSVFAQLNLKLTTSAKWQNLHFGFELAQIWNRFPGDKWVERKSRPEVTICGPVSSLGAPYASRYRGCLRK